METRGLWIKYDRAQSRNNNRNSSYYRLFEDLKNSLTNWHIASSLEVCKREICGEDYPIFGSRDGDIYVYYIFDEEGNIIPKIYFKTVVDAEGKMSVLDIHGANLVLDEKEELTTYNFNVEPYYISALVAKLQDIDADRETIEKYETQMKSFIELHSLYVSGVTTEEDILTLYSNFTREDTPIAREMMSGRCVQEDYNRLSKKNREKLFRIICGLNKVHSISKISPLERLDKITVKKNSNGKILELDDENMIISHASESGLKSLYYACDRLRSNRDFVLEVLRNFKMGLNPLYERNLPDEFTTDVEVLVTMTASKPFRLREVIESYLRIGNGELKRKLDDIDFVKRLLQAYYRSVLNDKNSLESTTMDCSILWHLPLEILEDLDDSLLIGPEPTAKREAFKEIIGEEHLSTRDKLISMRRKDS